MQGVSSQEQEDLIKEKLAIGIYFLRAAYLRGPQDSYSVPEKFHAPRSPRSEFQSRHKEPINVHDSPSLGSIELAANPPALPPRIGSSEFFTRLADSRTA